MKAAIRFARSRATAPQADPYVMQLAKDTLSADRSRCIEQTLALVIDIAQRGNLDEAEAIGLHLAAIARAEHAAAHPESDRPQLSIAEAHQLEERAEGAVEEAETAMAHNKGSLSHELNYLSAAAGHTRARKVLDEAVRRELAKDQAR